MGQRRGPSARQGSQAAGNAGDAPFDQPVDWHPKSTLNQSGIVAVFRQYDDLVKEYGDLPSVGSQIRAHVAKLRRQPEYAAVLNEVVASSLWDLAQKHERDEQLCCAYWVYKQAAELVPAPSALRAKDRFAELDEDPEVVAAAKKCRELKNCHQAYVRAERLLKVSPEKAKEIFAEIVERCRQTARCIGRRRNTSSSEPLARYITVGHGPTPGATAFLSRPVAGGCARRSCRPWKDAAMRPVCHFGAAWSFALRRGPNPPPSFETRVRRCAPSLRGRPTAAARASSSAVAPLSSGPDKTVGDEPAYCTRCSCSSVALSHS